MAEKKIFTGYSFQGGGQSKNLRLESATSDPTNVGKGHTYFNSTAATIKVSNADADATAAWKTLLTTDSSVPFSSITGTIDADTLDGSDKSNALGNNTIPVRDSNNLFHVGTVTSSSSNTQVVNKGYVDSVAQGLDHKDSVKFTTTGNIGLSGTSAGNVDDTNSNAHSAGDRILVKNQDTASQNGIYIAASGAWSRATDADGTDLTEGAFVFVEDGTVNPNTSWVMSATNVWTQFSGAGQLTAGDGLAKNGDTLSVGVASPISIVSDNVTIADGAITGAKLVNNTVTSTQLADSISLTTLAATGSVTANGGFITERPDNTAFLIMTQTGNETWSIAGRSGAGPNDYLDIGTATGKISIGETGGLGVGDIAGRDDDPQGTLHVSTNRYGTNEVSNGTLDGWDDSSNPTNFGIYEAGSSTVSADTSEKYEGSTSAKFTVDSSNSNVYIRTDSTVMTIGRKYKVCFYAKASAAINDIAVYAIGPNSTFYSPALTTSWAKYETTYTPAVNSALLIGRLAGSDSAGKSFWIDKIEITEDCLGTPSTLGDDLVVNNNSHAGISIITKPQTNYSRLFFGDSVTNNHASIYSYRTITTGDSNLYFEASNNNTPATVMTLYGNDKSAKFNGGVGIGMVGSSVPLSIKAVNSSYALRIFQSDSTADLFGVYEEADTRASAYVRKANGDVGVMLDSGGTSYFNGGNLLIGSATAASDEELEIHHAGGGSLHLLRTTASSSSSDHLGQISFGTVSGDKYLASVVARQDAAADAGKLVFTTEPTGTSDRPDRLSIMSEGWQDHHANSIVNSATVQGLQDGACYDFNPSAGTSIIDLGSGTDFDFETLTYSAWIKTSSTNTDMRIVCNNASSSNHLLLIMHSGKIVVATQASNNTNEGITSATYNDGKWHHVVAVRLSDSSSKCYVDGVEVALVDSGSTWSISGNAMIGAKGNSTLHYTGSMRDVKIFPSALAASDVRKLYGGENPKKNNNVELWANGESFVGATGGTPPQSWTEGNAGTFTLSSGGTDGTNVLRINRSSDNSYIYQTQTVVVGKTYLVEYRVRNVDASQANVGIGSTAIGSQYFLLGYSSTNFEAVTLKVTATTTLLSVYLQAITSSGTQAVEFDYVRVQEVGTLVDFNSQSASSTKWYNEAIPSLYNATVTGPTLSQGNTYWNNIKQDGINVALQKDNGKLLLGADNDLQIYYDGSYSHIRSDSGSIYARTSASFIVQVDSSSGGATDALQCLSGGTVKVNNKLGVGTNANANYALYTLGKAAVEGPLTIQNSNDGYTATTIAGCNNNRLAYYNSHTRSGDTKGISMGSIGLSTSTGIQCFDHSDNTANPFLINPFGGNVGIGTTTPSGSSFNASSRMLHVYQNSVHGATLRLQSSSADLIAMAGNAASYFGNTTNHPLDIYTNNAAVIRINNDGTQDHKANRIVNSQTVSDSWRTSEPSLRFDGSGDRVAITGTLVSSRLTYDITVSCWYKPTADNYGTFKRIWALGSSSNRAFQIYQNGTNTDVALNGTDAIARMSSTKFTQDKWYHLVATYDGTTVRTYVNGVAGGTAAGDEILNTSYDVFTIGGEQGHDAYTVDAEIKDVRIHNRALSESEVRGAYNGEATPFKYTNTTQTTSLAVASAANPDNESNAVGHFKNRNSATVTSSGDSWTGRVGSYSIKAVINSTNSGINGNKTGESGATGAASSAVPAGTLIKGRKYRLSYTLNNVDVSANIVQELYTGTTIVGNKTFTGTGVHNYSIEFTANGTSLYFALVTGESGQSRTLYIDNWKLVEIGEVVAYTPESINDKWYDETSNANHGTISGATFVGSDGHLGILTVKGRSEAGNDNRNISGCIKLGDGSTNEAGRFDFDPASTTSLRIDNITDNDSAEIEFGMKSAGTRVVPMQILGDGTVKAGSASSTNLKQVARVHSETETFNGSDVWRKIDHNLGTKNITVSVREVTTGEHVECAVKTFIYNGSAWVDSADSCTITFATAPANTKQYAVTVIG